MENNTVKQSAFRCSDCGGPKSTEKTTRCWDCALVVKRKQWQISSTARAEKILAERQGGAKMSEIARKYGISRQRVYQIVDAAGLPLSNKDRRGGKRG